MNLRLKTLAKMVDHNSRVADIGTDHAYLPIELVKNGRVKFAIASDIGQGPLLNAKKDIEEAGLQDSIETRLGNGLETITKKDEIDTVIVAGMGGKLMTEILNSAWLKGFHFPTLILEPNVGESGVRSWLMIHGYKIIQEKILAEAGHIYELIKAVLTKKVKPLTEKELLFGPVIVQDKEPVFYEKWQNQLEYNQKLLLNLNRARKKDTERIKQLEYQIKLIKEELDD
ncbi:MAG: class I SAM-dependent methyltransferase [Candidatus Lactobacillus pullistercoris]|uniref:Class I SAM-dependent methyltransferase n=1 Tax=Candidatus Lactobacillus pullistercoris TaxID=2838636 RepID=A0A9E2KRR3_9LACO|nr:class I SAM-dependent methyltransferase [Candidatus Lactobacillus pullistercoris]